MHLITLENADNVNKVFGNLLNTYTLIALCFKQLYSYLKEYKLANFNYSWLNGFLFIHSYQYHILKNGNHHFKQCYTQCVRNAVGLNHFLHERVYKHTK